MFRDFACSTYIGALKLEFLNKDGPIDRRDIGLRA